jgi:hypothetical protein
VDSPPSAIVRFVMMMGDMKCPLPGAMQQTSIVAVCEFVGSERFDALKMHLGTSMLIVEPQRNTAASVTTSDEGNRFISVNPAAIRKKEAEKIWSPMTCDSFGKTNPAATPPAIRNAAAMPAVAESPISPWDICVDMFTVATLYKIMKKTIMKV